MKLTFVQFKVITEEVYRLLETEADLKKVEIPVRTILAMNRLNISIDLFILAQAKEERASLIYL